MRSSRSSRAAPLAAARRTALIVVRPVDAPARSIRSISFPTRPAPGRAPRPLVSRADYEQAVERILTHIRAGNIYQANLTFPTDVAFAGPRSRSTPACAPAPRALCGIVFTASTDPLRFAGAVLGPTAPHHARPMKGTAPRSPIREPARRSQAARREPHDRRSPAQRSQPSLAARLGRGPALFEVETYPTLLQMTSPSPPRSRAKAVSRGSSMRFSPAAR